MKYGNYLLYKYAISDISVIPEAMHNNGGCTCGKDDSGMECPAAKYLKGAWDISEFFHLEDRKEAA